LLLWVGSTSPAKRPVCLPSHHLAGTSLGEPARPTMPGQRRRTCPFRSNHLATETGAASAARLRSFPPAQSLAFPFSFFEIPTLPQCHQILFFRSSHRRFCSSHWRWASRCLSSSSSCSRCLWAPSVLRPPVAVPALRGQSLLSAANCFRALVARPFAPASTPPASALRTSRCNLETELPQSDREQIRVSAGTSDRLHASCPCRRLRRPLDRPCGPAQLRE